MIAVIAGPLAVSASAGQPRATLTQYTCRTTPAKRVRITVNQQKLGLGWTEVDAVQLIGQA